MHESSYQFPNKQNTAPHLCHSAKLWRGFFTGAKELQILRKKTERIVFLQEMLLAGQQKNWVENSLEEKSISRSPGGHESFGRKAGRALKEFKSVEVLTG